MISIFRFNQHLIIFIRTKIWFVPILLIKAYNIISYQMNNTFLRKYVLSDWLSEITFSNYYNIIETVILWARGNVTLMWFKVAFILFNVIFLILLQFINLFSWTSFWVIKCTIYLNSAAYVLTFDIIKTIEQIK